MTLVIALLEVQERAEGDDVTVCVCEVGINYKIDVSGTKFGLNGVIEMVLLGRDVGSVDFAVSVVFYLVFLLEVHDLHVEVLYLGDFNASEVVRLLLDVL